MWEHDRRKGGLSYKEMMVMGRSRRNTGIYGAALLALSLFIIALAVWGCAGSEPAEPGGNGNASNDETVEDSGGGTISLSLYFRLSSPEGEWLSLEKREVSGIDDPYRAAMEELIKGPGAGSQLLPVLPDSVKVLSTGVEDGVCTVNVSKEILTDANQVGAGASGEGLALAAIADTLTAFPEVSRVRLLVEGMQSGMLEGRFVEDFWGHMGLPEYLERDEDIIYRPSS
jgi:germination protein M